jgi:undecaprenyl-phosphate 4-deoxy-4-formamido-L-arabinose transferase
MFSKRGGILNKKESLSVVIPVYNELPNLDELISRLIEACRITGNPFEIILVDDGSSDGSSDKINEFTEKYPKDVIGILLNRNYGQHAAIMEGFASANGDIIVTLDADLQNPPEEIFRLVQEIERGADVVGSVRVPRHDSLFRKVSSYIVNRAIWKSTGVMMHDYGCMLRAYRSGIVKAMLQCHERSTFIPVLANSFTRKVVEIEVGHSSRKDGDSKYSVWKLINLQFDLLTSMTTFPLRLLSITGVLLASLGIAFGMFLLTARIVAGSVWAAEGVFSLFAILFVFIGLQFVGMGLMGEYIGRIYADVRARPRCFVEKIIGKSRLEKV